MPRCLLILTACYCLCAEMIESGLADAGSLKVSHGYVVLFNRSQRIRGRDSLEGFDRTGRRVVAVDLLAQLPEATSVSVDDVAMQAGGPLVVGATIRRAVGGYQAMLLFCGLDGRLTRKVDLPSEQGIERLDIDSEGNVWTLAEYLGGRDDETAGPLVYEYDSEGNLLDGLLNRTNFGAGFKEANRFGGVIGFGVTEQNVWIWQPVRHRMTIANRQGQVLKQLSIPLPKSRMVTDVQHLPEADFVALLPNREVVAGIVSPWLDVPSGAYTSHGNRFVRSSKQRLRLIGLDGTDYVFVRFGPPDSRSFEIIREPMP